MRKNWYAFYTLAALPALIGICLVLFSLFNKEEPEPTSAGLHPSSGRLLTKRYPVAYERWALSESALKKTLSGLDIMARTPGPAEISRLAEVLKHEIYNSEEARNLWVESLSEAEKRSALAILFRDELLPLAQDVLGAYQFSVLQYSGILVPSYVRSLDSSLPHVYREAIGIQPMAELEAAVKEGKDPLILPMAMLLDCYAWREVWGHNRFTRSIGFAYRLPLSLLQRITYYSQVAAQVAQGESGPLDSSDFDVDKIFKEFIEFPTQEVNHKKPREFWAYFLDKSRRLESLLALEAEVDLSRLPQEEVAELERLRPLAEKIALLMHIAEGPNALAIHDQYESHQKSEGREYRHQLAGLRFAVAKDWTFASVIFALARVKLEYKSYLEGRPSHESLEEIRATVAEFKRIDTEINTKERLAEIAKFMRKPWWKEGTWPEELRNFEATE